MKLTVAILFALLALVQAIAMNDASGAVTRRGDDESMIVTTTLDDGGRKFEVFSSGVYQGALVDYLNGTCM